MKNSQMLHMFESIIDRNKTNLKYAKMREHEYDQKTENVMLWLVAHETTFQLELALDNLKFLYDMYLEEH